MMKSEMNNKILQLMPAVDKFVNELGFDYDTSNDIRQDCYSILIDLCKDNINLKESELMPVVERYILQNGYKYIEYISGYFVPFENIVYDEDFINRMETIDIVRRALNDLDRINPNNHYGFIIRSFFGIQSPVLNFNQMAEELNMNKYTVIFNFNVAKNILRDILNDELI